MARTIEIPSFEFSAFYYPQILEALVQRKRIDVPELTDESDFEPFIQLLRSFALVGHLNNVLLDLVAGENTLPTARLVETVRNMLRLIDYELSAASPASSDVVYELSKVFAASGELLPAEAQVGSRATVDSPVIFFEALAGLTIDATDVFKSVKSSLADVFTNHTTEANTGVDFTPWAGGPASKDALYFAHSQIMWDTLEVDVVAAAANITGIWEFFDGDFRDIQPTSVTDIGGGLLEVDLTSLLGSLNRQGTVVRITLNETGVSETVDSTWTGVKNIATIGLLGQTSPSTTADDYSVGTDWTELAQANGITFTDGTTGLTVDGDVEYTLPQTELQNWKKTTVDGVEAFWLRFRVIEVSTPTSPTLNRCRMDTGKQFAIALVTQGRSVSDDPLGSSTGAPNQVFETSRDNYIDNSEELTVDAEVWISVDNFLSSTSQDKHYIAELGENDRVSFKFGDGVAGRIPPLGAGNVSADYRFNAEIDGNVGANTIVVDKTGLTFVNRLFNPRQAGGHQEAEGSTEESLERAKIAGPATLRVKEVALNGDDAVILTKAFEASDGSKPFSRATAIEEGFGPKTVELITVAGGGVVPSQDLLDELELFFNGDKFATPAISKHYVANQEVVVVAFDPKPIDVVAVVEAPKGVTVAQIENRLNQIIQPEALKEDGVTFEWNFGGDVPISRLIHEIFKTDESIEDVDISVPAIDVPLSLTELPVVGTLSIVINEL